MHNYNVNHNHIRKTRECRRRSRERLQLFFHAVDSNISLGIHRNDDDFCALVFLDSPECPFFIHSFKVEKIRLKIVFFSLKRIVLVFYHSITAIQKFQNNIIVSGFIKEISLEPSSINT